MFTPTSVGQQVQQDQEDFIVAESCPGLLNYSSNERQPGRLNIIEVKMKCKLFHYNNMM